MPQLVLSCMGTACGQHGSTPILVPVLPQVRQSCPSAKAETSQAAVGSFCPTASAPQVCPRQPEQRQAGHRREAALCRRRGVGSAQANAFPPALGLICEDPPSLQENVLSMWSVHWRKVLHLVVKSVSLLLRVTPSKGT